MALIRSLLLGAALAGCSLPEEPGSNRMPDLPALASLQFDLSFFDTHTPDGSAPSVNWEAALERVAFIDSAAGPFFVVPAATFAAARAATPTAENNGAWRWTYATNLDGQDYTGYLRGFAGDPTDNWDLVVTAPGVTPTINNYLWAEGVSSSQGTFGAWAVYQPAFDGPEETVLIEWDVTTAGTALLLRRLTSDLLYSTTPTSVSLDNLSATPAESFRLIWNPQTGAGRIAVDRINFVCWDTGQHDVACP